MRRTTDELITGIAAGDPHADARFRVLVESICDYAIFMLDQRGHVLTWNAGAEQLKGCRANKIIGSSFERFYLPDDIARGWPQEELRGRCRDQLGRRIAA